MKLKRTFTMLFTVLCFALWIISIHQTLAQEKQPKQQVKKGLILFDYLDELEANVEVNLTDKLINLVTKTVSSKPEVAELIQMVDGIYLRTYGKYGITESEMIKYYQDKLKKNNWEVLVKIKDGSKNKHDEIVEKHDEIVEISLLYDEDVAYGIFVIFASVDQDEVTLINIVGEITPDRITELLKNLSKFGMTDIDLEDTLMKGVELNPNRDTPQKEILAVKAEKPPAIDGKLDDKCWKTAPQAGGFTHEYSGKPVKDQTIVQIVYTDKAIYLAWHVYESDLEKILTRQKQDHQTFLDSDSVCFSIDPFHTHKSRHRILFMTNPLGQTQKQYIYNASEKPKKYELTNHWKVAVKTVNDGWVAEMEIPWKAIDYPDTTDPIQMGINFIRKQERTGEKSWWSNIGVEKQYKNDGNWMRVIPPSKSSSK